MDYYKLTLVHGLEEPMADVLIAALGDLGFESFETESETKIFAYIPENLYLPKAVQELLKQWSEVKECKAEKIETKNWNEEWEKQYVGVVFGEYCFVHAPFHPDNAKVKHNIIIEPKMSFGTAHHPTTALMINYLEDLKIEGKRVLDMGCGTAVLAILADKEGAAHVDAIDNDSWAYKNSLENTARNQAKNISVYMGDADLLKNKKYDLIIANINRNILLKDMEVYSYCLEAGGILLLSGFYQEDIPLLEKECNKHRLFFVSQKNKENWAALRFFKK